MYEPLRLATQPLTVLLVLLAVVTLGGLRRASSVRWRRAAWGLAWLTAIVCHPYTAWHATHALEAQYPHVERPLLGASPTLVVLSGGILSGADARGILAEDSLVRTVCAARLARQLDPGLIVVTGGVVNPATPTSVAQRMRDLLVEWGVPHDRILVEPRAMTTVGNARESWSLLSPKGQRRIALVTDAIHMPRSVGIYRAVGFDVVPLPCDHLQTGTPFRWTPTTALPGPRAAWLFNRAAHEWIALAYYRARGEWR